MWRMKRGAFEPLFVSKKREVFKIFCMLLLACAVYGNIFRIAPVTVVALPARAASQIATTPVAKETPVETATTESSLPAAVLAVSTRAAANRQDCTVAAPYQMPETLSLGTNSPALTKVIDATGYYQIYGSSLAELRSSIQSCPYRAAVAGDYHAVTARQINWSYSTSQTGNVCTLQDLHVGLHMAQLLPAFTPDTSTPASVAADWNTYAANLATHENGHIAIATEHVEQLVTKLQAIGPIRCDLLRSHVATMIDAELTILNTEDALYDSRTNHGATQGAVL